MKQIADYIIDSILDSLVPQQSAEIASPEKKGLTGDQKLWRVIRENPELVEVLMFAAKYNACIRRAEQQIKGEVVIWDDKSDQVRKLDAWCNEWLQVNVIYNSKEAISLRLVETYEGLRKRHSELIGKESSLSDQMNELNTHSARLLGVMEKIKKGNLNDGDKEQIRGELDSLKEGLKTMNFGKEVEKPSVFIEVRVAKIKRISNELNEARNEFEAGMEKKLPEIFKKEKADKQGLINANDKRIKEIDERQAAISQRLVELGGVKQRA